MTGLQVNLHRFQYVAHFIAILFVGGCSRNADHEPIATAEAARSALESENVRLRSELSNANAKFAAAEKAAADALAQLQSMRAVQSAMGIDQLELPKPDWTPERVLRAYFDAPSLAHRLVLVKDVEVVRPLMAEYYRDYSFRPAVGVEISAPGSDVPIGAQLSVAVKLRDQPVTDYLLARTTGGYRIDWLASKKNWEAAIAAARPAKTPREELFDEAVKHEWVQPWYRELDIGGKAVRADDLDVQVGEIVRSGDRFDLFIAVTNVSSQGHVFSPATHPYNDQMRFQGKFVDSFANWTLLRLERGTHDMKPGQSAKIHYSADVKIDAPLYLIMFPLDTSNEFSVADGSGSPSSGSAYFYLIVSNDDFQKGQSDNNLRQKNLRYSDPGGRHRMWVATDRGQNGPQRFCYRATTRDGCDCSLQAPGQNYDRQDPEACCGNGQLFEGSFLTAMRDTR